MTNSKLTAAILASLMACTAHAKDDPETAALKQEWKAAKKQVIVTTEPGMTAAEAHDRIVKKLVAKGALIKTDNPYQVVAEINMADTNPTAAMFVQALAGDPYGGAPIGRVVVSFIENNGEPLMVRYCGRMVMTNRYGGEQAGDCTEGFKAWRTHMTDLRALLAVAPVSGDPVPMEDIPEELRP